MMVRGRLEMKPAWLYMGIGVCAVYILLFDLDVIDTILDLLLFFPVDLANLVPFLYLLSFISAYVFISFLVLNGSKRLLAYFGVIIINGLFLFATALLAATVGQNLDLWFYLGYFVYLRIPITSLLFTIILLVMLGVTSYLKRRKSLT
jgi:hypothetical protein